MGRYYGLEEVTKLFKTSSTTVGLPSGAIVKVGGQTYTNSSTLSCSTGTLGFGGIDVTGVAASSFYYVYAVVSAGVLGLVASLSADAPSGFNSYRKVGAFYTDASSNILRAYFFGEINKTTYSARYSNTGVIQDPGGVLDWATTSFASPTNTFTLTIPLVNPMAINATTNTGAVAFVDASVINNTNTGFQVVTSSSSGTGATGGAAAVTVVANKAGIDAVQPDWSL